MKKIIFLDVDGTLVDMQQNIAESTKEAIKLARQNGHYVVLCTGRMYSGIYPWLFEIGFDGVVASAGANVYWAGEEIFSTYIPKEELVKVSKILDRHNATYTFQGSEGRFMDKLNSERLDEYFTGLGMESIINEFKINITETPCDNDKIESGIYINCDVDIDQVQKEVGDKVKITGASFGEERRHNGEFTLMGTHKASGIKYLIDYLNLSQEDVIAVGDGLNDLEMIDFANVGVAMGNAVEELKKLADFVTTSITDDGVYNAFKKLELI